MFLKADTIKETFLSTALTEVHNLFFRFEDVDDDDCSSLPSETRSAELLEILSNQQKELNEYISRIAEIRAKVKNIRSRVVEKYQNFVCDDANLSVSHESFRKDLDSKVSHSTQLMVNNRVFLEKINECNFLETNELDASQNAVLNTSTGDESSIYTIIGNWTNTRLGVLTLSDSSHVVLDASESTLLIGKEKKSVEDCNRIRGQVKQPLEKGSSFGFNSLHPLRGSMEDMEVAEMAVKAKTPSVLVNHLILKQVEDPNF